MTAGLNFLMITLPERASEKEQGLVPVSGKLILEKGGKINPDGYNKKTSCADAMNRRLIFFRTINKFKLNTKNVNQAVIV